MTPYAQRRDKRKAFAVKTGVYIAILLGVLSQSVVQRFDARALTIDLEIGAWSVTRFVLALVVATAIYWRLDGKGGELAGKVKNVGRVLTLGFTSGYTLMGIAGIGE